MNENVTITVWAGRRKFVYHPDASATDDRCLSVRVGDLVTVWPLTSVSRFTIAGVGAPAAADEEVRP